MESETITSYVQRTDYRHKYDNILLISLFTMFVLSCFISAPVCCIISYVFTIYFIIKNDYNTLWYFVSFIAIQNITLLICANRMNNTWVTWFTLSKEIMIYGCVFKRLIFKRKIKKKNVVFIAYLFIVLFSALISNAAIYSRIVSLRQMLLPLVCFAFGYGLKINRQDIRRISNYIIGVSVLIALIGFFEFFIFRDTIWHMLPVYQYQLNKGTTFELYNSVPLNFYSWDLYDIIHIVVRRLVSIFVDPLITGHFLLLGFVLASSFVENKTRRITTQLVLVLAIVLTMSKGALICLVIYEFMMMGRRLYRKTLVKHPLSLLVIGVIAIVVAGYLSNVMSTSSIGIHLNGLLKGFSNASLFGEGLGNAGVITGILSDSEDMLTGESYIGVLIIQMGYVGFILYFVFFVKMIVENYKTRVFDNYFSYRMGSLMIGLMFECMFSESSIGIVATGLYFIFSGIVMKAGERTMVIEKLTR